MPSGSQYDYLSSPLSIFRASSAALMVQRPEIYPKSIYPTPALPLHSNGHLHIWIRCCLLLQNTATRVTAFFCAKALLMGMFVFIHHGCLKTASRRSLLSLASLSDLVQKSHTASLYLLHLHNFTEFQTPFAQQTHKHYTNILVARSTSHDAVCLFLSSAWEQAMGATGRWEETQ